MLLGRLRRSTCGIAADPVLGCAHLCISAIDLRLSNTSSVVVVRVGLHLLARDHQTAHGRVLCAPLTKQLSPFCSLGNLQKRPGHQAGDEKIPRFSLQKLSMLACAALLLQGLAGF